MEPFTVVTGGSAGNPGKHGDPAQGNAPADVADTGFEHLHSGFDTDVNRVAGTK